MSGSEQDFSESSNLESPHPQESPYSSPSQQVPHLASAFSGITCDDVTMHFDAKGAYLRVVEQPQDYFRFRYKSEMVGTHGCLLGKSTAGNKGRTHPMVELMNYTGKALIRVTLAQAEKEEEHPHKLLEDEQEDRDVSTLVPQQGSYKVGFAGMGIIHTAKKDVPGLLFKKYMERSKNNNIPPRDLKAFCENTAKTINLNIVRLRFSAHDLTTDKEICPPAFSEPIHNMKSAATNDLKICRISRYNGRARGGDDVFILVEKVNKKNIIIRFYELNEQGEEVWTANGNFLQSDVHHQYAIVFRTPPYREPHITKNVKVYLELVRPSDGRTSEPKEFIYKADQVFKNLQTNKRRRVNSSLSSLESCSGSSSNSLGGEVPATVEMIELADQNGIPNLPVYQITIPQIPVRQTPQSELSDLGDALYYNTGVGMPSAPALPVGPMLGAPNVPEPPVLSLNSTEFERLIRDDNMPEEEKKKFCETDWTEYMSIMRSLGENVQDKSHSSMEFLRAMNLVPDSGKGKVEIKKEPVSPSRSNTNEEKKHKIADKTKVSKDYDAFYTADDGNDVKKLVKEICEAIKNKKVGINRQLIRGKLERLFEMRLSNGDTFLHMALSTNQPSLEYIVKLVHSMRMPHLLNLTNELQQTILHLAIIKDLQKVIPFLISKGCDPMAGDLESNNAIHYAVICGGGALKPLLDAVKLYGVACDLNAYNNDRHTALHLAALYDSAASAALLLDAGCGAAPRDGCGRTALHLAACDGSLAAAAAIAARIPPSEVDSTDGAGNTALQILCAGAGEQRACAARVKVIEALLDKQANPHLQSAGCASAWRQAQATPQLKQLFAARCPPPPPRADDDVKSEPEDDFESGDEGDFEVGLSELPLYIDRVASLLDARGSWRELARRLHADSLLSWYEHTRSPATTLLTHLRESGDSLTSKSLMLHLLDMGEAEAADVIRALID